MTIPIVGDKITFRAVSPANRFGRITFWRGRAYWDVQELPGSLTPGRMHRVSLQQITAINGVSRK